jgi:hypothetical protein
MRSSVRFKTSLFATTCEKEATINKNVMMLSALCVKDLGANDTASLAPNA